MSALRLKISHLEEDRWVVIERTKLQLDDTYSMSFVHETRSFEGTYSECVEYCNNRKKVSENTN